MIFNVTGCEKETKQIYVLVKLALENRSSLIWMEDWLKEIGHEWFLKGNYF